MQNLVLPLVTFFAGVIAQNLNDLPECERNCVNNGVSIGPAIGCPATDNGAASPTCLCGQAAFAYAIRDCAAQSCPEGTNLNEVSQYGLEYCQSAQSSVSGTTLAAITIFSTATSSSSGTSRSAVTTIPIVSNYTTDGSTTQTTVGETTIYSGDSSTPSGPITVTPVTTAPIVSTVSEATTTRETTIGSTTQFSTESSTAAGATMAPVKVVPAFVARPGNRDAGVWQALGWTVAVVGLVQLVWPM